MPSRLLPAVAAAAAALALGPANAAKLERSQVEQTRGPLRVHPTNPRYFADRSGRPVYLTGSHVWWNLLGSRTWKSDCRHTSARPFAFTDYLDRLASHDHNFIRLWTIELTHWRECGETVVVAPQPWLRTGPGVALDGLPRFDLRRPNPAYFRRLRSRVRAAGARGMYVSVMLFEGWGVRNFEPPWRWRGHPFNRRNNVNGVNGDANRDGTGKEVHTLAVPRVTAIQAAYVRRVVNTVYDLDNVLFEISNESGAESTAWQYHIMKLVRRFEAVNGDRRHPVGMTFQHPHGTHSSLLRSSADWISPFGLRYLSDPPPAGGRKVSLSDTDHHCGLCGDDTFPWKSFLRGHNPIYMDDFQENAHKQAVRRAMGQTRRFAQRIDLARARPRRDLSSTGYCLAAPGREYLVYQPRSGAFKVNLRAAKGRFAVEWFDPSADAVNTGEAVSAGRTVTFAAPFAGPAVLYLRR